MEANLLFTEVTDQSAPNAPKNCLTQPTAPSFQEQLSVLAQLQQRIEQTQKELDQLARIQANQTKKIDAMVTRSILVTRNRVNLWENHQRSSRRSQEHQEYMEMQRQKVKEMRQRTQNELKEAKEAMKKSKDNQRLIVRNRSIQHYKMIQLTRQAQLKVKENMVKQSKKHKQQLCESLASSRLQIHRRKEALLFNQTLAKIQTTPSLVSQLQKLLLQKESMQSDLLKRKQAKNELKAQIDKIRKVSDEEINRTARQTQIEKQAGKDTLPQVQVVTCDSLLRRHLQQRGICR